MTSLRSIVTVLVAFAWLVGPAAAQTPVTGTWELTAYDSPASVGKASGQLVFADGRFSLVYTMDEASGRTSGRAHAGRYTQKGNALTLEVDWTMEYVGGKGQASRGGGSRRTVTVATAGDALTLTYENGSIQRFRRVH